MMSVNNTFAQSARSKSILWAVYVGATLIVSQSFAVTGGLLPASHSVGHINAAISCANSPPQIKTTAAGDAFGCVRVRDYNVCASLSTKTPSVGGKTTYLMTAPVICSAKDGKVLNSEAAIKQAPIEFTADSSISKEKLLADKLQGKSSFNRGTANIRCQNGMQNC